MNTERYQKLTVALEYIMQVLTTQYHPEKVILFGSMAEGMVGEWSDIDLVIIKDTPLPFLQRLKEVALLCRVPVSVDFLVYTPDEFAQMIVGNNPFIVKEILQKGKVVYQYYIPMRYPDGTPGGLPGEAEAQEVITAAETILQFVTVQLS